MAGSAGGIRAGRAFIEIFGDKSKLVAVLRSAQTDIDRFSAKVRSIGAKLFAGGTAMLGSLAAITSRFANTGQELAQLSRLTGASVESLSALQYAAQQSGASIESVGTAIQALQGKLVEAAMGSNGAIDAFVKLGVNAAQLAQLSPADQFKLMADRLSQIRNPALRAALATQIFGGAANDMVAMIGKGAAGISALEAEGRKLGVVMAGKDASAASAFTIALSKLWSVIKGVGNEIGAALAPVLTDLIQAAVPFISTVVNWIKENRELVVTIAKVAAGIAIVGAGLIGVSFILSGFSSAIGAVASVFGGLAAILAKVVTIVVTTVTVAFGVASATIAFMLTPIGMLATALAGLAGYFIYSSGVIGESIGKLSTLFGDLKNDAMDAFGGIKDALAAGDFALAAEIAWLGLKLVWQRGVSALTEIWQNFKSFFLSTWNEASSNLAGFFINALSAISSAWTETIDFLADVWSMFTSGLMKTWNNSIGFIKKAWVKLKGLFSKDINVQAEVERINKETDDKNQGVDDARDKGIGDRDAERRKHLAQIEADRKSQLQDNEAMRKAENDRIASNRKAAIDATQADLDAAKGKFQDSIARASKAAGERGSTVAKKFDPEKGGGGGIPDFGQVSAIGTFSGFGLRGIGNAGPLNDIKTATQQTAANTDPANQRRTEKMYLK
jgi:hypothetical protein